MTLEFTILGLSVDTFFAALESITTLIALIFSIICFIQTIKSASKDREDAIEKESLLNFFKNADIFFRITDPENILDYYTKVYSKDGISKEECLQCNKDLCHINGEINYQHKLIQFSAIDEQKVTPMLIDVMNSVKVDFTKINNKFCDDLKLIYSNNMEDINHIDLKKQIEDYTKHYNETVDYLFRGINILKQIVLNKKVEVEKFLQEGNSLIKK